MKKSGLRTLLEAFLHDLRAHKSEPVTRAEALDYLFGKNRGDPEARYLERRLKRTLTRVLAPHKNKKAGRDAQPFVPSRDHRLARADYPSTKLLSKRARDE